MTRPLHSFYFLLFLTFIYFTCFYQLSSVCMLEWDESRVAKSSYEMSLTGDALVVNYDNRPDLWSTKPPFVNWIQAIFIKAFGLNEVAVRLPSALAGTILLLFLFFYLKKHTGDLFLAYLVPLILGTSGAFYSISHSFRSADYDAILATLLCSAILILFSYLEFNPQKEWLLYLSAFLLACAVLTKGIAGILLLPGLLLYLLITGGIRQLLKRPHVYRAAALFLFIVIGYYGLRELRMPGYLRAVNDMETFGRFNNTFEAHSEDTSWWISFAWLVKERFQIGWLFVPLSLILIPHYTHTLKRLVILSLSLSLSHLLILSFSKGKGPWYDLPDLPFLSLAAGIALFTLVNRFVELGKKWPVKNFILRSLVIALIAGAGFVPAMIYISDVPGTREPKYQATFTFQNYIRQKHLQKKSVYIANVMGQSQFFYYDMAREMGYTIDCDPVKSIKPGQTCFAVQKEIQEEIEAKFNVTVIDTYNSLKVYRIGTPKI